jgi:hypothetical protein
MDYGATLHQRAPKKISPAVREAGRTKPFIFPDVLLIFVAQPRASQGSKWQPLAFVAMGDFVFRVSLVAVVRVRAADRSLARQVVPTVLGAPGAAEIALANQNNVLVAGGECNRRRFLHWADQVLEALVKRNRSVIPALPGAEAAGVPDRGHRRLALAVSALTPRWPTQRSHSPVSFFVARR